jgi:hypothetical protein
MNQFNADVVNGGIQRVAITYASAQFPYPTYRTAFPSFAALQQRSFSKLLDYFLKRLATTDFHAFAGGTITSPLSLWAKEVTRKATGSRHIITADQSEPRRFIYLLLCVLLFGAYIVPNSSPAFWDIHFIDSGIEAHKHGIDH